MRRTDASDVAGPRRDGGNTGVGARDGLDVERRKRTKAWLESVPALAVHALIVAVVAVDEEMGNVHAASACDVTTMASPAADKENVRLVGGP